MQVLGLVEVKHQVTWQFYVTRIMPIGLFMALTLYMGNVVYLYLTVSFIQMLKVWPRSHDIGTWHCATSDSTHVKPTQHQQSLRD